MQEQKSSTTDRQSIAALNTNSTDGCNNWLCVCCGIYAPQGTKPTNSTQSTHELPFRQLLCVWLLCCRLLWWCCCCRLLDNQSQLTNHSLSPARGQRWIACQYQRQITCQLYLTAVSIHNSAGCSSGGVVTVGIVLLRESVISFTYLTARQFMSHLALVGAL